MCPPKKPICEGSFYMIPIVSDDGTVAYITSCLKCEKPCHTFQSLEKLFAILDKVE